jgi:hypothetical protein
VRSLPVPEFVLLRVRWTKLAVLPQPELPSCKTSGKPFASAKRDELLKRAPVPRHAGRVRVNVGPRQTFRRDSYADSPEASASLTTSRAPVVYVVR